MTDTNAPTSSPMTETNDTTNNATTTAGNGMADDPSMTVPSTASDTARGTTPVTPDDGATASAGRSDADADPQDAFFAQPMVEPVGPEASPNGAWLAYLLPTIEGTHALWLSPTDGGEPVRLEVPFLPVVDRDPDSGRVIRGPQWSPDGRTLALAGSTDKGLSNALWLVPLPQDLPAVTAPALTTDPEPGADTAAPATDASASVATDANDASGADTPDTADAAGAAIPAAGQPVPDEPEASATPHLELNVPTQLTDPAGTDSDRSPRWSLDGEAIAFVATRGRLDAIALVPVSGELPSPSGLLTWSGQDDREPVWSKDGQFLAFTRQRSDGPEHADLYVYNPRTAELKNLTSEKASAVRHSLDWVPGRNLIGYVTVENDWLSISVINADNKAGWTVTRESGDKTGPRFAPDEARLVYVRTEGFSTVCCERGLHASGAIALDPGEGVVSSPLWLGPKRVVYGFSAPQKPLGLLAQDNLAEAERATVQMPNEPSVVGMQFRSPVPFEFEVGPDEHFSGMFYRTHGMAGSSPALIYLPDGPLHTRRGGFQMEEQALASTGIAVLTPVMHGASGFGQALEGDLAAFADTELEVADIAASGQAIGAISDIAERKLGLVGVGYGGTLALVTAGARPGTYAAVVAIDPVTDWATEITEAPAPWRNWVVRQYGLPFVNQDRYALRTPMTFGAVIDVPVVLVGTRDAGAFRRAQLDDFAAFLDEEGIAYTRIDAGDEPLAATLRTVSRHLARQFFEGRETGQIVEGVRADEIDA